MFEKLFYRKEFSFALTIWNLTQNFESKSVSLNKIPVVIHGV